jgi:predicted aldo/keto reductase-like oxidoreductase
MWKVWPRETFIGWMTGAIDKARTCLKCGQCEPRCPYQLPIRERIDESIAYFDRVTAG